VNIDKIFLQGQLQAFHEQESDLEARLYRTRGAIILCEHLLDVLSSDTSEVPSESDPAPEELSPSPGKGSS
jgi:hypothetical protein